jgi:hypothetical protein
MLNGSARSAELGRLLQALALVANAYLLISTLFHWIASLSLAMTACLVKTVPGTKF